MSPSNLSTLEFAVLGLLRQTPRSGYDLMKLFASTAMGSFSGSPGTIYPAVKRLERRRFVAGTIRNPRSLRRRREFHPTPAGLAAFDNHLQQPVSREDVVRNPGAVLLRFAFAGEMLGDLAALRLIEQFADAIEAYLPELREQLAHLDDPRQAFGRRALQRGIEHHESDLRWARRTALEIRACIAPAARASRRLRPSTSNHRGKR